MNQIAHNVPSLVDLVEQGWVPDLITRLGMRGLNHKRPSACSQDLMRDNSRS